MNIFFPLVEYYPISYVGELGIYISNIIEQFMDTEHKIYISLPFYKDIDLTGFLIKETIKKTSLGYDYEILVYEKNNFNFYFIKNYDLLYRENIYGYNDDIYRFSFYTYCILELITDIAEIDIVNINDWHIAFLPLLFEIKKIHIPIVLNIFDIKFQGVVDKNILNFLNITNEYYYLGFLEFYDKVNILKSALILSKKVIFYSNIYLNQLLEYPNLSFGLNGVLKLIESKCYVINKGINNSYNPEKDNIIHCNFSNYDLYGKIECKTSLQKELSLPVHTEIPIIIIPSNNIEEDEIWLLSSIIPYLIRMEVQIIILGNKLADFEKNIKEIAFKLNCSVISLEDNDENLRKTLSASDILLDISTESYNDELIKISLAYGVLPIVMSDSPDLDLDHNRFRIFNFTPNDLINTIKYTINKYYDMDKWNEKSKKVMNYNFSMKKVSEDYIKSYSGLLS